MILKRQTPIHVRTSNEHFKTVLPYNSEIANIADTLVHMQNSIYQYFSEKYGCVNTNIFDSYSVIYGHLSKSQLKLKLQELNTAQYPGEDEIKFVSGQNISQNICPLKI